MRSSSATRSSREVCEKLSNAARAALHRRVHVLGRAEQDLADRLFGRRIDDVELAAARGADPRTVDEELSEVVHGSSEDAIRAAQNGRQ